MAVSAHALGDGHLPALGLTALLMVLVGWVSAAAAEYIQGPGGILLLLGGAQLVTHFLLGGMTGHGGSGLPMTVSHVGATLLTALLLARAETLLAVAASAVRRLLPQGWREPDAPAAHVYGVVVHAPGGELVLQVLLRRICRRRGPPSLS